MLESLESRQLMAATPLPSGIIGIKVAKVSVDGIAEDSDRITIGFQTAVRLGSTADFRSFGYSNDLTTTSGQKKETVGLTITQPVQTNGFNNVIQIVTDRLIRKGSRLFIYAGGLTTTKGAALVYDASTAANTITFTVGQNKPRYSLSNRAFFPTDDGYVSNAVYTNGTAGTTASTQPSAASIGTALQAFLQLKVSAGLITTAQMNTAMTEYSASSTIGIIPDANLRAALVSLVGTVASSAFSTYTTSANVTGKAWAIVTFSSSISASAPTAETKLNSSGRLQTIVRNTLAGESFVALSAILAREAMHQANVSSNPSTGAIQDSLTAEVIDNDVAMTVYSQQMLVEPSIAGNGTFLTNYLNTMLVALLNSGQKLFPYGGVGPAPLLNSPGNIFVGAVSDPGGFGSTTPVVSFDDYIRRDFVHRGVTSDGIIASSPYAVTVLHNIVGTKTNVNELSTATETALDTSNTILTDVVYIDLAHDLKLNFA